MKAGQRSRTADGAAALRASHTLYAKEPLFSDPYALALTSSGWQKIIRHPLLHRFTLPRRLNPVGLLIGQVVGRARYAEDQLELAIKHGVKQFVLVGAGLDSFVLRRGHDFPELQVFEVDHPDTQAGKKSQLAKLGDIPNNVEFVPINFEQESIAHALDRSTYQRDQIGFFSWLGTTHYLEPQTTLNTLKAIAEFAAAGSEVVFDYSIPYHRLKGFERLGSYALSHFTDSMSEPLIGQFIPEMLHQTLDLMGYEVLEDLSGSEQDARYFQQRTDHVRATAATHLIHIRLRASNE